MKLDITKGIQRKGTDVPFDLEDNWGEDHWNGDTIAYVGPVSLSGTYMLADETVLVRGEARAVIQSPCARCLTPTNTSVTAEVDEAFIRDKGDGGLDIDEDQYTYTGHVLELDDAVRTAILLELPSRILCKEDCREAVRPVWRKPERQCVFMPEGSDQQKSFFGISIFAERG
ncbi:MAG: YceD family protein [Oscillospiraceae bacterium]